VSECSVFPICRFCGEPAAEAHDFGACDAALREEVSWAFDLVRAELAAARLRFVDYENGGLLLALRRIIAEANGKRRAR
jgi:hypothetical protein